MGDPGHPGGVEMEGDDDVGKRTDEEHAFK